MRRDRLLWRRIRRGIPEGLFLAAQTQPCLRASPLPRSHGRGLVFDDEGRVALCDRNSPEYAAYVINPDLEVLKAMRSQRA